MARSYIPALNTISFTAVDDEYRFWHVFPVTRENVYHVRRIARQYIHAGYHVHAAVNHNGRLLCNVFGTDIYTQARKREEMKR